MSEIQTKLCLAWFIACDTVPNTTAHRYIENIKEAIQDYLETIEELNKDAEVRYVEVG